MNMKNKAIRNLTVILLIAFSFLSADLAGVFPCTGSPLGRDVFAASKSKSARSKKYVSRLWTVKKPIAHACGGINKIHYTNSLEALNKSISRGVKTVEIDFIYSTDNVLICAHNSRLEGYKPMTAEEFRNFKIGGKYTTMTADEALSILAQHKCYLVVDSKNRGEAKVYKELLSLCDEMEISWYKNYIIPQIYSVKGYKKFQSIYKFKYGIFTMYKLKSKGTKTIKKIARICKRHKLVACCNYRLYTKETAEIFRRNKVAAAVYTVDRKKKANALIKRGARYIFTDNLY